MADEVQINVQQVYERLGSKLGRLEVENAQLLEAVEGMVKEIAELKNPARVNDAEVSR